MDMEQKIDKIQEDMSEVKVHLAQYNTLLDVHIKRTELLEQTVEPIKKHVAIVNFIGKVVLAALGTEIAWELIKRMF